METEGGDRLGAPGACRMNPIESVVADGGVLLVGTDVLDEGVVEDNVMVRLDAGVGNALGGRDENEGTGTVVSGMGGGSVEAPQGVFEIERGSCGIHPL